MKAGCEFLDKLRNKRFLARPRAGDFPDRPIVAGRDGKPGRTGHSLASFLLQPRESRQSRERAGGHHDWAQRG